MLGKDSGWAWCVAVASFVVHCIVSGLGYSCGVFHGLFMQHFNSSHFSTAWVAAFMLSMTAIGGIPGFLLTYQVGYRVTIIAGGLLAASGFALSAFAVKLFEIYLTAGVLTGLGFGIALMPSILIIENYFCEKRSLAVNVVLSGVNVGIFLFPLLVFKLEEHFAWKGMAFILAGLCLNICLCGVVIRPNCETCHRKDVVKMFEPSLLKSSAFVALLWSNVLWSLGVSVIFTHLPGYAVYTGLDPEEGAVLVAIVGISGFSSRSMFEVFSQSAKLDHVSTFICTIGLSAILTGLHTELFQHKAGEIGYAIMLGLQCGYWSCFIQNVIYDLIGEEYIAYGKGFVVLSIAIGLMGGPPLAGWLVDQKGDYDISFYLAGSSLLLSSCVMMIVSLKRCHYRPLGDWLDSDSESSAATTSNNQATGIEHVEDDDTAVLMSSV